MSGDIALFHRFPELRNRIPHRALGRFPTPVEPLRIAGIDADLWVKRDDLSGEAYGGNKVRKLEFLLGRAEEIGARRLITAGAAGSHHCLATTVYGTALGFEVTAVLFPQPVTPHVEEVLLASAAHGAEIRTVWRMEMVPVGLLHARMHHRREVCAVIPPGGSDAAGTLGYVSAALELAEQVEAGEMPPPEVIHVAAGTMGTAAGIAIGLMLAGLEARVHAVRVVGRLVANHRALRGLVRRTLRSLEAGGAAVPEEAAVLGRIELAGGHLGSGYGVPTPAGKEAIRDAGSAGLLLDPTYTGKVAAGTMAFLRERPGGVHLYWHTLSAVRPPTPEAGLAATSPAVRRLLRPRK